MTKKKKKKKTYDAAVNELVDLWPVLSSERYVVCCFCLFVFRQNFIYNFGSYHTGIRSTLCFKMQIITTDDEPGPAAQHILH